MATKGDLAKIHERLASLEAGSSVDAHREGQRERQKDSERDREPEANCGAGDGSDRDSEGFPDIWPKVV